MKNSIIRNAILVTALLASSIGVWVTIPTSFHVSPTGSDSNSGSLTSPLRTIPTAISKASDGDTVYVHAGTYSSFVISKSISVLGFELTTPVVNSGSGIILASPNSVLNGFEVTGIENQWGGGSSGQ